mgnify:CR=1 FL=1
MTTLVRPDRPHDQDLEALKARVADLETVLIARSEEATRSKAELDAFRIRYRSEVGLLHEELDRLELALAEAELGIIRERVGEQAEPAVDPDARLEAQPRFTTDAIRKLFRDVAKIIHPDLARDAGARDRRHALMAEANRAYANGDEAQLRLILQSWELSPESVQGTDGTAERLRLERRIRQLEEQLDVTDRELADLKASPVFELKAKVDEAAAKGRDLVAEMVKRLERDLLVATNRLNAMRH